MLLSMFIAAKWIDGPIKRVITDEIVPGSVTCRITCLNSGSHCFSSHTINSEVIGDWSLHYEHCCWCNSDAIATYTWIIFWYETKLFDTIYIFMF